MTCGALSFMPLQRGWDYDWTAVELGIGCTRRFLARL
jgi:hypothetical protein